MRTARIAAVDSFAGIVSAAIAMPMTASPPIEVFAKPMMKPITAKVASNGVKRSATTTIVQDCGGHRREVTRSWTIAREAASPRRTVVLLARSSPIRSVNA